MAILCLARDFGDLGERMSKMVVAFTYRGEPVRAEQIEAVGAMQVLLRDAIHPNLVQSLEGTPAFVHGGPFANIAQGTNTTIATRMALKLADYVVTEAGFATDLGAEKFFHIKCRASGLRPSAAVLVATVRALRRHGGGPASGTDAAAVRRGGENLARHLAILGAFGVPTVVALNAFPDDAPEELRAVRQAALEAGARAVATCTAYQDGGAGALELARAVREAAAEGAPAFRLLYRDEAPLAEKVEAVARSVYGADGVDWPEGALAQAAALERLGFGRLPVCIAKTHLSLSHDPALGASPRGFRLPVRELRLAAGAGFVTVLTGAIQLMPGLPAHPAAESIDVDEQGRITGLR
jgi:formyltetrahydrofolate synthetase